VAWTVTLSAGGHVTLSDGNLIVESASRASDGTVTTTLTAISTASGATAWTKTINGRVELFRQRRHVRHRGRSGRNIGRHRHPVADRHQQQR